MTYNLRMSDLPNIEKLDGYLGAIISSYDRLGEADKLAVFTQLQDLLNTFWAHELPEKYDVARAQQIMQLLDQEVGNEDGQLSKLVDDVELFQAFLRGYKRLLDFMQREQSEYFTEETRKLIVQQLSYLEEVNAK